MTEAAVVGSGPNGLAAAVTLARAGVTVTVYEAAEQIGGGARSGDLTGHGVIHDLCSAAHPFALASGFARDVGLEAAGLRLCQPEIDVAHPLEDGTGAYAVRSLDATVAGLGADGRTWRRLVGPVARGFEGLADDLLQPVAHPPAHPVRLARFGLRAAVPAAIWARAFTTPQGRALWGGIAAHAWYPFTRPLSSAIGVSFCAAAHGFGWVVAEGGTQAITDTMAKLLLDAGGRIETGVRVGALADLPPRDLTLLDVAPAAAADLAGDDLAAPVARALRRWRFGPAAYKVDLVVEGGVPWRHEPSRRAGTVHVGGSYAEVARDEALTWRGRMPSRPFLIVCQQYLADPSRSNGDLHPVYCYAHVPHGYTGDATGPILDQLERFAPGLRDRTVATHVTRPADFEAGNANWVGGDIVTGANTMRQVALRPRIALDPYALGPGIYLCSAATPPGAGAHGMCGWNAARSALRSLR